MSPAEINQDPVQGEFFTSESDLAERLVRESIQNSLDAALPNETVRVRFAFSREVGALPVDAAQRYREGFNRHLEAVAGNAQTPRPSVSQEVNEEGAIYQARDLIAGSMTYMTVEDFGTSGLSGNIEDNHEQEKENHFWGFFRSVGISPKGDDKGGSWGLGKWVFPDASEINAYIGVTKRSGESRTLLMGMAILRTHHIGDDKYPPYGQFAAASAEPDSEWLPMPVDSTSADGQFVRRTLQDFRLQRGNQSGLSVIVPWPKPDLTGRSIARAVITQYFLPILERKLVVEIEDPDARDIRLDTSTLESELTNIDQSDRDDESPESLRGLIRLAQWAVTRQNSEHIEMPVPQGDAAAKRGFAAFDFAELQERFNAGERLALQLSTKTQRKHQTRRQMSDSVFRIYLERDEALEKGHDYFVRGHLRIPLMDHIRDFRARALIVVDGASELGHLLRDAEGPAHTVWNPHAQRLKDAWSGGTRRVQEVRRAAPQILRKLVDDRHERQLDALADLFPSDLEPVQASTPGGNVGNGDDLITRPVSPLLPRSSSPVRIEAIAGGFRVTPVKGHAPAVDSSWFIRFAYDLPRGGKKKAFNAFAAGLKTGVPDFDLESSLQVQHEGVDWTVTEANEANVTVCDQQFLIEITGFDDRDILVEMDRLSDPAHVVPEAAG